ncbi:DUF72 domain-containing protein [Arenimonas oryziterrae]|uniref:DUF72 domain-containing protein n=1 Tax=Arenimonas oryziterrae DSM 21050 = YC6267 TaxID=1121015 RepID=A0A091B1V1_9GAMM|nr:DUF72 domain-containing protein [Arenimonas oryziterrae]KFN44879.1 hypothetical protein N789_02350 [Arenimonas oryziterrae DSM 21050 = YC6267]
MTADADLSSPTAGPDAILRVGVGGWTFVPWRNNFYPSGWVQRRELEYASRKLTAIEINGTFYGAQKPAVYAKWAQDTPDGFVFSLKAPGRIVDSRSLRGTGGAIEAFVSGGLAELGDRLGPLLWQLGPNRIFDADEIAAFLDLLPRDLDGRRLRHVLEVRNDSFLCPAFLDLMRRHGHATVFTDSPKYPSFADVCSDFVYARLMRSQAHIDTGYTDADLDTWAARARRWSQGGAPTDLPLVMPASPAPVQARDVFVYFISSAKERNPAAAMALRSRLDVDRPAPVGGATTA